ncbi:MAG: hypothetical protein DWQ04_32130 [Chloroflexi bacterium]|nr:MAG: hypothetical protein DWQ04_32130 [Chloroflexota bacterium]
MKKVYLACCILIFLFVGIIFASENEGKLEPILVKDIDPGYGGSFPTNLTNVNGTLFFTALDENNQFGLWKSDGSTAGTVLVKEISTGIKNIINVDGTLFFTYDDEGTGGELWKSDGTTAGTVLVKVFNNDTAITTPRNLTNVDGALFFTVNADIWKSDGTESGTVLVKDFYFPYVSIATRDLTNVDGTLFFTRTEYLWKSDGTEAGTVVVRHFDKPAFSTQLPTDLLNVNGTLYLIADDRDDGDGLWKSDGTGAGTVFVKEFGFMRNPKVSNATLYFFGNNGLWKSDGTATGTILIKPLLLAGGRYSKLSSVGDIVFFIANDGVHKGLWKSDGTVSGTVLVKAFEEWFGPTYNNLDPAKLTSANGLLYFFMNDDIYGTELWQSDGTEAGTVMVADINPGEASGTGNLAGNLINVNDVLFFTANDGAEHGAALWKLGEPGTTNMPEDEHTIFLPVIIK